MAASDKQCAFATCLMSSMVRLVIGVFICLLFAAISRVVKSCIARRRVPDADTGADNESKLPEKPRNTLPTLSNTPAITTVTTMPGHAVSDVDRDIKSQIVKCQELQDLEAAIYRNHTG